jgi:ABC-type multidrug transport system fused ATPase/permease subunit
MEKEFTKKTRPFELLPFISGLLLFLLLDPYMTWPYQSLMFFFVTVPLLGIFWYHQRVLNVRNTVLFLSFAAILLLAAACKRSNLFGMLAFFLFSIIPFMSRSFTKATYRYFKNIYVLVLFIGLLVWILVFLKLPVPHGIIPPMNTLKDYYFDSYPLLVIPHTFHITIESIYASFRFCGPFEEPGVVGTISLLILLVEDFNLKDKKNIVLLLTGLLSFSIFFYVASFMFALYYMVFNRKWKWGIIVVLCSALFFGFTYKSPFFKQLLWERLEWNSEKKSIAGDDRSGEEMDAYFNKIKGTSIYYFGTPDHKLLTYFSSNASYKNSVLTYGILSCGLYLLCFSLLALLRIGARKEWLLFVAVLVLTLYQRPSFFSINYIFLFVMVIATHAKIVYHKPVRLLRQRQSVKRRSSEV